MPEPRAAAWIFVNRGEVAVGAGDGLGTTATTHQRGQWERVAASSTGCPADLFAIVASTNDGGDFYVDSPEVEAVAGPLCTSRSESS